MTAPILGARGLFVVLFSFYTVKFDSSKRKLEERSRRNVKAEKILSIMNEHIKFLDLLKYARIYLIKC